MGQSSGVGGGTRFTGHKGMMGEGMRLCRFVLGLFISSFGWLARGAMYTHSDQMGKPYSLSSGGSEFESQRFANFIFWQHLPPVNELRGKNCR